MIIKYYLYKKIIFNYYNKYYYLKRKNIIKKIH